MRIGEVEVTVSKDDINEIVLRLLGMKVWFVNAGGAAGSSFSISFGEKRPRDLPLRNPSVSEEFRKFEGESTLYVWCTWRLESKDEVVSSDQEPPQFIPLLEELVGQHVTAVKAIGNCFDLDLVFGDYRLYVFCDHVPPDPSFSINWEMVFPSTNVIVGPGFETEVSPR